MTSVSRVPFRRSNTRRQYATSLPLVLSRNLWNPVCRRKLDHIFHSSLLKDVKYLPRVPRRPFARPRRSHRTPSLSRLILWRHERDIMVSMASNDQRSPQHFNSYDFLQTRSNSGTPFTQNSYADDAIVPISRFVPGQPRIQVSSLLTGSRVTSYHLEVIQHPQKTAEFGSASLSRLPLTPPIVARLTVRDHTGNTVIPEAELPFLIAHLSLHTGDGLRSLDLGSAPGGHGHEPPRRLLYGNLVSSAQKLEDLQGNQGLFFLFSDVSIRWRGRYQIGITLLRLSRMDSSGTISVAEQGTVLAQARTRPFEVLSHHDYTAAPQTRLTQCFLRQGARIFNIMPTP